MLSIQSSIFNHWFQFSRKRGCHFTHYKNANECFGLYLGHQMQNAQTAHTINTQKHLHTYCLHFRPNFSTGECECELIEYKCNWMKLITLRFISFDVISCSSLAWLTSSCACAEITQDVNKHVSYSNLNQTWWRKTATNTKHHTTDLMCAQGTYQTHTHAHTYTLIVSLVHIKSIKPFGSINKYSLSCF